MLIDIEPFFLDTFVNTDTLDKLETPEEQDTGDSSPEVDDKHTETLCAEESPAAACECATLDGQQSCHHCSEDTTHAMNGAGTYRVIDMKFGIDKLDREHKRHTADKSDDYRSPGSNQVATS